MEANLPEETLEKFKEEISERTNHTDAKILSLVGFLQHATIVVRCGRVFVSQMYATAVKL